MHQVEALNVEEKKYDEMFPALASSTSSVVNNSVQWGKTTSAITNGKNSSSGNGGGGYEIGSEVLQVYPKDLSVSISSVKSYLVQLQQDFQVRIDVSSARATGITTFVISGKNQNQNLSTVKRQILSKISRAQESTLDVPKHLLKFIIGNKGKNLNEIRRVSMCEVRVPSKKLDDEGLENDSSMGDDSIELVSLKFIGDFEGIEIAKKMVNDIIHEKESKIVVKLTFESIYMPFLFGYEIDSKRLTELYDGINVRISFVQSTSSHEIILSGDKEVVNKAIDYLQKSYEDKKRSLKSLTISIKKRQHKFLVGPKGINLSEIFERTGCTVELPAQSSSDDNVIIRGFQDQLVLGLQLALEKANSVSIEEISIPKTSLGEFSFKYLIYKEKPNIKKIEQHYQVQVFLNDLLVEIQGSKENVLVVKDQINHTLASIHEFSVKEIKIPHELHRFLFQKFGSEVSILKPKVLHFKYGGKVIDCLKELGIDAIVPPTNILSNLPNLPNSVTTEEELDIIYLYSKSTKPSAESMKRLDNVEDDVNLILSKLGQVVNHSIPIEQKFHARLIGHQGKGIEEIKEHVRSQNGQDATVNLKFPKVSDEDKTDPEADSVVIRGTKEDVHVCVEHLKKLVDSLKHYDFIHSHEFSIEVKEPIFKKLLQKGGGVIQGIKENPNVRLAVNDKNRPNLVLHLQGIKNDVDTLKKVLQTKIHRLNDEVNLQIQIDPKYHGILIGKGGQNVKKLSQKYDVQINFPKSISEDKEKEDGLSNNSSGETSSITIIGFKPDAESAKQEILDLVKWELDHAHCFSFLIPKPVVKQILGKGGLVLQELKGKLGQEQSDLTEILFLDNIDNVSTFVKSVYSGIEDIKYEGQDLVPDADSSLCLMSGSLSAMKKLKQLMEKFEKEVKSQSSISVSINPNTTSWWTSSSRLRLKSLILMVVASKGEEVPNQLKIKKPSNPTGLSDFYHLKERDDLITSLEDGYLKVSFPPRKKTLTEVMVRGKTELVESFAKEFSIYDASLVVENLNVKKSIVKIIIGAGGQRISELRNGHDVEIDIAQKENADDGETAVPVKITGVPDRVRNCMSEIEEIISSSKESRKESKSESKKDSKKISISKKLLRYIIGPSGSVISKIRDESGCQIIVPSMNEKGDVEIIGKPENIEQAVEEIEKILKKYNTKIFTRKIDIASRFHGTLIGKGGANIQKLRDAIYLECPDIGSPLGIDIQFNSNKPKNRTVKDEDSEEGFITVKCSSEAALDVCEKLFRKIVENSTEPNNSDKEAWGRIDL